MTSKQFRFFVFLSLVTAIAACVFEWIFQARVSDQLNEEIGRLRGQPSDLKLMSGFAIGLVSTVMSLIATFAMLVFKPWAPRLGLTSTFIGVFALTLMGAGLASSAGTALGFVSTVFWGSVLTIGHTPMYAGYRNAVIETHLPVQG
jgi:hypothetical protein